MTCNDGKLEPDPMCTKTGWFDQRVVVKYVIRQFIDFNFMINVQVQNIYYFIISDANIICSFFGIFII